jgi:hypothetical protein
MLMLSDSVRLAFTRPHPDLEQMDAVDVRGRQAKVVIWAPARAAEPEPEPLSPTPAG